VLSTTKAFNYTLAAIKISKLLPHNQKTKKEEYQYQKCMNFIATEIISMTKETFTSHWFNIVIIGTKNSK